jgi:hypothetical protein
VPHGCSYRVRKPLLVFWRCQVCRSFGLSILPCCAFEKGGAEILSRSPRSVIAITNVVELYRGILGEDAAAIG